MEDMIEEIMYANNCDEDEAQRVLEDLEFFEDFDEGIQQGYYEDLKVSPADNKFYYGWGL